jgi:hypothetical protein
MNGAPGRFTQAAMTEAMHRIARDIGVSAIDATLLRLTNNAVYALPATGIVVRITRSYGLHERVHKVVRLARWFAEIDAPTIRLVDSIDQPAAVPRRRPRGRRGVHEQTGVDRPRRHPGSMEAFR